MQVSAHSSRTLAMVQTVQTRPRGLTSSGRHPIPSTPSTSGNDPLTDTQSRRAISRSGPAPIGIVVTGDNHLSAALPGYSPERRAERQARLRAGFSATVDYALQHGARLFVIAGDLFDTPTPSNAERAYVAGELARLRRANVICLGVTGMSDSPRVPGGVNAAESPYATYAALDSLIYFPATTAPEPHLISVGDLRLAVVGISTNPTTAPGSDPLSDGAIADPEGVLARAHVGLLVVHSGVEGFGRAAGEERILTRASLQALPPTLRIVVAGHIHRFGRARIGECEIIVPGSTERMDFDSQPGSSGFAWLEVGPEGLARVKRVAVVEQPRADQQLSTAQLFPTKERARLGRPGAKPTVPIQREAQPAGESPEAGAENNVYRIPALAQLTSNGAEGGANGVASGSANAHDTPQPAQAPSHSAASDVLETVRATLDSVTTEDTLVRLRLAGPITSEQYHLLPLRQIREYGSQHAFAFELDTSGLRQSESGDAAPAGGASTSGAYRSPVLSMPLTPSAEVERLLSERMAQSGVHDPDALADLHAAAQILLARLQASGGPNDREA